MIRKIVAIVLVFATSTLFGMSVSQLNKASKEDLMQIKGIGEAKAEAIIKYRKKTPFKSFADVEEVKGVGPALADNIKNDVHQKAPSSKAKKSSKKETTKAKKTTKKEKTKSKKKEEK
jgi:competence protein ComEA